MSARTIGFVAVCFLSAAPYVHAQSRMDQALDAQSAKCRVAGDRSLAEAIVQVRAGIAEPEKMIPLMAAERACWADYNELQARADNRTASRRQYVQPEWSPSYPTPSANLQAPAPPTHLSPLQSFDPGYAKRPSQTVVCAGTVMISGPPDQPNACAGPR